jgi:2-aminoadipate transaminase
MKSHGLSELARRTADPPISWLMKVALAKPGLISLAAGFTDDLTLPVEETRAVLDEIFASPKAARAALQYGSTLGDGKLRELTAEYLTGQDNAAGAARQACDPERLLITHGSQQLLYLLTECLCDPGDIVLLEDPTYFVFLGILQSHGLRCRGVPVQDDGIDLKHLEATLESLKLSGELPRVKMLYSVTYFQNPSGVTASLEKKAGALELLRRFESGAGHPIYFVEDAAYRDLRFEGEDIPSVLSLAEHQSRVVYSGTFSKPFATGIRVGYGLFPRPLLPSLVRLKGNHDFGTSNLLQQVLARALDSCRYRRHLGTLRQRYRKKAAVMVKAIREHFPAGVSWREPRGGLYVWAGLPGRLSAGQQSQVFRRALDCDVLYVPGELCYAPDPSRRAPKNQMRLSFGSASEDKIREGIQRLGKVIRECCPA